MHVESNKRVKRKSNFQITRCLAVRCVLGGIVYYYEHSIKQSFFSMPLVMYVSNYTTFIEQPSFYGHCSGLNGTMILPKQFHHILTNALIQILLKLKQ